MNGLSILRIVAQSTPAKKGWLLISSAECEPRRWSADVIILRAHDESVSTSRTYLKRARVALEGATPQAGGEREEAAHLRIKSSASRLKRTSSGKYSCCFQSMILRYVSCAFSLQKGGYPTRHSNMMAPSDHQSHSWP